MSLKTELLRFLAQNNYLIGLRKYVITTQHGTWMEMHDTEAVGVSALNKFKRQGLGFRLELWIYPILEDDMHGAPTKIPLED